MNARMNEINLRKSEIRDLLNGTGEVDLDALQAELEELDEETKALEKRMAVAESINIGEIKARKIARPEEGTKEKATDYTDTHEYRKAFMEYVLTGKKTPELRADEVSMTTENAAVIPTTLINRIIARMETIGVILPRVTRTAYKGGVTVPTSDVKPVATWVAEGAGSEKQKLTTGSITFAYHKLRCAVAVTLEMDVMAIPAFEAYLVNSVAEAMVRALETAILNGTGTGQPKGLLTETAPEDQEIEADEFGYSEVLQAEGALPQAYESEAVWLMAKKTFFKLLDERDQQEQPIARVNEGLTGVPAYNLKGREVVLCDDMTAIEKAEAGDAFAVLFDLKDYVLNTNYGITVSKYVDHETDDTVTKAILLADGKVIDVNSLVVLKKKAAG